MADLDTSAVAALLGVKPATVWQWGTRGIMPEPSGRVGDRPWWKRDVIERWARQTGRWPR